MPEESVLMVALTLLDHFDVNWEEAAEATCLSGKIVDCSGKKCPPPKPRNDLSDTFSGATLEDGN